MNIMPGISNLKLKFEYIKNEWIFSNFIRTTNLELIMNYKENLNNVLKSEKFDV